VQQDLIFIGQYLLISSVAGLAIYYLIFFKKLANYQSSNKNIIKEVSLPISVIICAKNELDNLKRYLPAILNQDYSTFEIVVVIDHCADGSFEYLERIAKTNSILKVFSFDEKKISGGKKEALAFGISKASHEQLLLTDADCYPRSNQWIKHMVSGFKDETQLVLGIGLYESNNNKLLSKVIQWDTLMVAVQYLSYSLRKRTYMSVGRNVAYTKSLFTQVNGFDSHLDISSGDDDLFVKEAQLQTNTSIIIERDSQTISLPNKSWSSYINQKSRHFSTSTRYDMTTLILLGLYQLFIIMFYISFVTLLTCGVDLLLLLTLFLIKNFVQATVFKRIFFKIGVRVQLIPFLFFDIMWVSLLTFINVKRIISPRNKW
jgi:glycosyltransferase involved in cell wall biosynthesis